MDLIHGNMDLGATRGSAVLPVEFSKTWPAILAFMMSADPLLIPDQMTVFYIIWIDPKTDKYVAAGYYLSTSEPGPRADLVAMVVSEVTVPVKHKSEAGLIESAKYAVHLISEEIFKSPAPHYQKLRNKLEADIIGGDVVDSRQALPVERVSESEYRRMLAKVGK